MSPRHAVRVGLVAMVASAALLACGAPASTDDAEASADRLGVDEAVTIANWQQHPEVKAVELEVGEARTAVAADAPSVVSEDVCGLTRSKLLVSGTFRYVGRYFDDLEWRDTGFFYDHEGRLRLVTRLVGGPFGIVEGRAYFDERGSRFWEVTRMALENLDFDVEQAEWSAVEATPMELEPDAFTPALLFERTRECASSGKTPDAR